MNEVKIFENPDFGKVRIVEVSGEPFFVAADICNVLELSNTTVALDRLDADEKTKLNLGLSGGPTNCVNEYGLYNLIMASRKASAKEFKRWVTHDVLPSIRKHGAYMTEQTIEKALTSPDFLIQLATQLKTEQEKRKVLEQKVEQDKPLVLFADSVQTSHTSILIGDLAKILKQNGVDIGQKRLFGWMREQGFLMKGGASKNMPSQYSMERGLMEIKESTVNMPDGSIRVTKTTKVTGKGQIYFVNKFLGENEQE